MFGILSLMSFVKSPAGKYLSIVVLLVALTGAFLVWIKTHDAAIVKEAVNTYRLEQNNIQLQREIEYQKLLRSIRESEIVNVQKHEDFIRIQRESLDRLNRLIDEAPENSDVVRMVLELLYGNGEPK